MAMVNTNSRFVCAVLEIMVKHEIPPEIFGLVRRNEVVLKYF